MRLLALTACLLASGALAEQPPNVGAPPGVELKGTLKERLDAGGYSYLRIASAKGEVWAAVPQATLEVGKEVSVAVQTEMRNFESIVFGTLEQ